MRSKAVIIGILAIALILAGCAKAECKKDADCTKPHFTGTCIDKKCTWTPIPNECGNSLCETGENKCTCSTDCGACEGKSGKYLVQQCNALQECTEDIPATAQKPIALTRELTTGGSKISVASTFNQPFNTRKDQFGLEFGLNVLAPTMSEATITRLELTGMTPDKRTIPLADKSISRTLHPGAKAKELLIIEFPTADKDGELTSLNLKVYLDYLLTSGTSATPKSTILQHAYQSMKFAWARPETPSGCPASCDDANPGTQDSCGPETMYFCQHTPVAGACGNGICDANENKCTCPSDCGPCSGSTTYLSRSCANNACISQLKPGITAQPQSLFDDRDIGPVHLQNTYKYSKPFNTKTDKLTLEFTLYEKQESVSSFTIKDIRVLDGTNEVASISAGRQLSSAGQKETVELSIPAQGPAEQERNLALRIWYEYVQGSETKQGDYSKALGKTVLLNPDA